MKALHEAVESFLINTFEDAQKLTFHAKRVTLMSRDMILLQTIRKC